MNKYIKIFYGTDYNIGDVISPVILEYFTEYKSLLATSTEKGKLLMVGSFLELVKNYDTVLGIGLNKPDFRLKARKGTNFISVRGPLTRERIENVDVSESYGDPTLLLPLIYFPKIEKTKKVGIIPHYIDKPLFEGKEYIDIEQNWKTFVDEILACDEIISSTLHGIVIAEAYGIPVQWAVYSDNIEGGEFKYQDYFLGTNRIVQKPFTTLEKIPNLQEIQSKLINDLKSL